MTPHARLIVHCVHTREGEGIMGITVRCERCGGHLMIGRDGSFDVDEGCTDGEAHADPSVIALDEHGGPRAVEDDSDNVNSLLNRMAI